MFPELSEELFLHERRGDTDIARDYNNTIGPVGGGWQEKKQTKKQRRQLCYEFKTPPLSNTGKAAASLSVCDVV